MSTPAFDLGDNPQVAPPTPEQKAQMREALGVEELTNAQIASIIDGTSAKTTLVDADVVPLTDSEDSGALKKATLTSLWTWVTTKLGALTSLNAGGAWAFTSTTRPTSSGTGTPDANSLITRDDGDARYERSLTVVLAQNLTQANGGDFTPTETAYETSRHISVGFLPKKIVMRAIIRFKTTPTNAGVGNFNGIFGDFNPANANMSATTLRAIPCVSVIKDSTQDNYIITCEMSAADIATAFSTQFNTYGMLDFSFFRLRNLTGET
jgi:hypothetical protein